MQFQYYSNEYKESNNETIAIWIASQLVLVNEPICASILIVTMIMNTNNNVLA